MNWRKGVPCHMTRKDRRPRCLFELEGTPGVFEPPPVRYRDGRARGGGVPVQCCCVEATPNLTSQSNDHNSFSS